jgi:hypothetical protein
MENNMTTDRKLNNGGSFHEQKKYVDSLPIVSIDDDLSRAIKGISEKPTPFDVVASAIPSHLDVKIFHHAVTGEGEVDSDSDNEDNNQKSSTAVVTRQLTISQNTKSEKMVMHFPGENNGSSQTIKIKFNPDGSIVAHRKDVPMSDLQKDLLLAEGKKQAGIVVEAHDTENDDRRYSAYTRK